MRSRPRVLFAQGLREQMEMTHPLKMMEVAEVPNG